MSEETRQAMIEAADEEQQELLDTVMDKWVEEGFRRARESQPSDILDADHLEGYEQ